jgi:hypothetical protein
MGGKRKKAEEKRVERGAWSEKRRAWNVGMGIVKVRAVCMIG